MRTMQSSSPCLALYDVLGKGAAGGSSAGAAVKTRQPLIYPLNIGHHSDRNGAVAVKSVYGAVFKPLFYEKAFGNLPLPVGKIPVSRHRHISSQRLKPRLCDEGIFHRHDTADAPAGAGVKLDEIETGQIVVFDLVKHPNDVFYSVGRKIFVAENGGGLSPGRGPSDTDHTGF